MKETKEVFVLQRLKDCGSWQDISQYSNRLCAEHEFTKWAKHGTPFIMRLIVRRIREEELLIDHVW